MNGREETELSGNGECILIVDDETAVLDLASILFELSGYKVITSQDAFSAFETYEKQCERIDVVMLDIAMPVMDGVELSRILVEINPDIKIIVTSGQISQLNELELRKLGIKHFLAKPFAATQLLKTVADTLNDKA